MATVAGRSRAGIPAASASICADQATPLTWSAFSFATGCAAHPDDADAYAALKRGLAVKADGNFKYYTDGKSAFVAGIVGRARAEMQARPVRND